MSGIYRVGGEHQLVAASGAVNLSNPLLCNATIIHDVPTDSPSRTLPYFPSTSDGQDGVYCSSARRGIGADYVFRRHRTLRVSRRCSMYVLF